MPWIALTLQAIVLPLAHASTVPWPGETLQAAAVPAQSDSTVAALSTRLAIGFATEDRGFRLESFEETARALAESLDYEFWLGDEPVKLAVDPEVTLGVPRPRLIAIPSWDSEGEALAAKLGVGAMLVVKSASGKKGKETKKRYVPSSQMFSGATGTSITYVGLSYRLKFELYQAVQGGEVTEWQEVSSWRVDEDERDAPTSVNLGTAVDGRITLTLADVIKARARAPLGVAAQVVAFRSVKALAGQIVTGYAALSEEQRTEFWVRAAEAHPVELAMPIEVLMELAFTEWGVDIKPTGAELERAKGTKKPAGPTPPGPMDSPAIQAMLKEALSGTRYLYGSPLIRSVQRFVHRWSGDTRLQRWSRDGLEELDALFSNHSDLALGSHGRAHTLSFGQIEVLRRATPRQLSEKSYFGSAVILLSEDCLLPDLFKEAAAPRALHGAVLRYSEEQAKAERKSKAKRYKAYSGAQLLELRDGEYDVAEKVPQAKLTNADIYRMLDTALAPRWPHAED